MDLSTTFCLTKQNREKATLFGKTIKFGFRLLSSYFCSFFTIKFCNLPQWTTCSPVMVFVCGHSSPKYAKPASSQPSRHCWIPSVVELTSGVNDRSQWVLKHPWYAYFLWSHIKRYTQMFCILQLLSYFTLSLKFLLCRKYLSNTFS